MVHFLAVNHLSSEDRMIFRISYLYINSHDRVFTNAENVEAKSIDDRLVDKLVREGIKPNMSVQF